MDRWTAFLTRRWLPLFAAGFGLFVWLPFLAPLMMQLGLDGPGRAIYFVYSFLCHQLPQRSFFLFGPQSMYSLAKLERLGADTGNLLVLRQFTGSAEVGWKVAWSDRMVSLYGGIWLAGLLWRPLLRGFRRLPVWGLALFALPLVLDGASHFASDLAGFGHGFRDSNLWLAALTRNAFSPAFYAGDALGSFNSWLRLATGLLFGLGVVWFSFPYLEETLSYSKITVKENRSPD